MALPWRRNTLTQDAARVAADLGYGGPGGTLVTRDLARVMDGMIAAQASTPSDLRSLPGVAAAVRMLAQHISQLQLVGPVELPLWLRRPRTYGGSMETADLLQYLADSMVIHGKGYMQAVCTAEGDSPSFRLDPLDPNYVQVRLRTDGVAGREFLVAGEQIPEIPPVLAAVRKGGRYIVHVPYRVSVEHPEGTTPLAECATTLRGHLTTEAHASLIFDNGTYSGGLLSTTSEITPAQAEAWRDAWITARKTGKVAVLGNGLEYRNEVMKGTDAQMVETRAYNTATIYAMLGIPQSIMGQSMIGGQSSLSYSNAKDNNWLYSRNALRPLGEQISTAFSQLLPHGRGPAENRMLEFDYSPWEAVNNAEPDNAAPRVEPAGDDGQP